MFEISRSTKWAPTGGYSGSPRHWQSTADASVSACLPYGPLGNKIVERGWQFFGWVWVVFFFFRKVWPTTFPSLSWVKFTHILRVFCTQNHGSWAHGFQDDHFSTESWSYGRNGKYHRLHPGKRTTEFFPPQWCWKVRESSPKCPNNSGLGICL